VEGCDASRKDVTRGQYLLLVFAQNTVEEGDTIINDVTRGSSTWALHETREANLRTFEFLVS
jgi:hypothetical protein